MFGRKKYKGSVQIVDDDEYIDLVGRDDRAELRNEPAGSSDANGVDNTATELRGLQLREAEKGKQETERALRQALEARDLGASTAKQLDSQTEQLEKNSRDLAYTHEKLDEAEAVLYRMKTPKILRAFRRKPKSGKGLKEVKVGRKDTKKRDELRRKGTSSIDIDGFDAPGSENDELSSSDRDEDDFREEEEKGGRSKRKKLFGRKGEASTVVSPQLINKDYSEYDEPVRQVLRDQDKNLDLISQVIKDTNQLAQAMGHEIDLQAGLIDQVQDEVHSTRERTKTLAQNIKEM